MQKAKREKYKKKEKNCGLSKKRFCYKKQRKKYSSVFISIFDNSSSRKQDLRLNSNKGNKRSIQLLKLTVWQSQLESNCQTKPLKTNLRERCGTCWLVECSNIKFFRKEKNSPNLLMTKKSWKQLLVELKKDKKQKPVQQNGKNEKKR